MNDLRNIFANTAHSSLTSLSSMSTVMIPSNKIIEIMLDQYFYSQTVNSPFAAVFFQCLVYCFGLTAMKALMDVWRELEEGYFIIESPLIDFYLMIWSSFMSREYEEDPEPGGGKFSICSR